MAVNYLGICFITLDRGSDKLVRLVPSSIHELAYPLRGKPRANLNKNGA
jgi:hypothetical protein